MAAMIVTPSQVAQSICYFIEENSDEFLTSVGFTVDDLELEIEQLGDSTVGMQLSIDGDNLLLTIPSGRKFLIAITEI